MTRRRISAVARWGSTFLSVVIVAAWVGSQWRGAFLMSNGSTHLLRVGVWQGVVTVSGRGGCPSIAELLSTPLNCWIQRDPEGILMGSYDRQAFPLPRGFRFRVPLYLPLALTLAPAAFLWRREIRRRRMPIGRCAGCGYDRAGLAPDAKCPECGKPALPARA